MKKIADILTFELEAAFRRQDMINNMQRLHCQTDRICVNISVMARWRRQKLIRSTDHDCQ